MIPDNKPVRSLSQQERNNPSKVPSGMYLPSGNTLNFGSESNANFVDVISVGPVTAIDELYINETNIDTGEFPLSKFHTHGGEGEDYPFDGDFKYAERTIAIGKTADIVEGPNQSSTTTTFKRSVSSKGVKGIRVNFTTGAFTHKDNKNRKKDAVATFYVHILNSSGQIVRSSNNLGRNKFYSSSPMTTSLTVICPEELQDSLWEYEVVMVIRSSYFGTAVSGTWSASSVTEFYKDTQTYNSIAYCSGKVVASDTSGSTPKRQYLVKGYEVLVPALNSGGFFTGYFNKSYSTNPAWNAMAVLVDDKWGAGLDLDKINIASFRDFAKYCDHIMPDGSKRYTHSQVLIKADDYFRIAAQIVGTSDGKLFEDSSGRVSILIDAKTDNRRVITSYDIVDEYVKRTTVSEKKKTNYVQAEFPDKDNLYKKTIISTQDDAAVVQYGIIKKELRLDTCTNEKEARRIIEKMLVTSQVAISSYVFKVGHTHEDIQVGEVVALYDRKYARSNYCGKVADGSTLSLINIDKRTPINLEGIDNPVLVLDNNRGVPTERSITSWTDHSITLDNPLQNVPQEFASFAVKSSTAGGLKPTLCKVVGLSDNSNGTVNVEAVEYNDSLFNHVENGTPLVIEKTRILPEAALQVEGLTLLKTSSGLTALWDNIADTEFTYYWKKFPDINNLNISENLGGGTTTNNSIVLEETLTPARYAVYVYIYDTVTGAGSTVRMATKDVGVSVNGSSPMQTPSNVRVSVGSRGETLTEYNNDFFTVEWDHNVTVEPFVSGYIFRVTQEGITREYRLGGGVRSHLVSREDLVETFGEDYKREFQINIIAFDTNLDSTNPAQALVNNPAPTPPTVSVRETGDLLLTGDLPNDTIGTVVYIWNEADTGQERPADALKVESLDLVEINLPDDYLKYDNSDYTLETAWVDRFGDRDNTFARTSFAFGPDVLIPIAPDIESVVAEGISSLRINFSHDGKWLQYLNVYFKEANSDGEYIKHPDNFIITGDNRVTYDPAIGIGSLVLSGLEFNTEYIVYLTAANVSSLPSENSDTAIGSVTPYADVTEIVSAIEDSLSDININVDSLEARTDVIEADLVDVDQLASDLQDKVDIAVADLDNVTVDVQSLQVKTDVLNTSLFDTQLDVNTLQDTVTSAINNIVTVEGRTDVLEVDLIDLDATVESLNSSLSEVIAEAEASTRDLSVSINNEVLSRKETDKALFDTATSLASFRQHANTFESKLTDAVFELNSENGTIGLKAYNYTDQAFSQAAILVDGVNSEINIQAGRITDLGNAITDANSEINVLAGEIQLRASYTEMTEYVSGAIDKVIPAYAFGFFNSAEGWVAVNGALTQGVNLLNTTWGDVENTALNYLADDNASITLDIKRVAGSGYTGDLVVTFDDGSTQTYTGVVTDTPVDSKVVKVLNLSEEATYTGTVTGLRIVLGSSIADEFEIHSITVGKPSAQLEALDNITATVNQLGVDLDAVEGQLSSYVTTTFYDQNTVTLNNVTQVLDGEESVISFKALQQELNDQGTITKANSATSWIDGAEGVIRNNVVAFNAEEGGVDDQLAGLTGSLNTVQQELSTIDGASIRDQLVSINALELKSNDLAELQFYTEANLLDQQKGLLSVGESVATADREIKSLADDLGAVSSEVSVLKTSSGTLEGQVDALITNVSKVETDILGNSTAISTNILKVNDLESDLEVTSNFVQAVDLKADNTASALNSLTLEYNDSKDDITANTTLIQNLDVKVEGEISARTLLDTRVSDVETGVTSNATLLQEVDQKADGNSNALSTLGVRVTDAENDISSNATLLQEVGAKADGNTTALNVLGVRVADTEEDLTATSTLVQQVELKADEALTGLSALDVRVGDTETGINANSSLIQSVDLKVDGNTSTINILGTQLTNVETGVSTNNQLLQTARNDIDSNAEATSALETRITDTESNVTINSGLIQQVELDTLDNANAISQIDVRVTDAETGLVTNATLIQEVDQKADGISTALNQLDARVVDAENDVTANSSLIQQVDNKVDGNILAISQLETRVGSEEAFTQAQSILNSEINKELGEVRSVASTQLVSISGVEKETSSLAEAQFYSGIKTLDQERGLFEANQNIAIADRKLETLTTDFNSISTDILNLEAKSIVLDGEVTATLDAINQVKTDVEGNANAISSNILRVNSLDDELGAASTLIQEVDLKADGAVDAINTLQLEYNSSKEDISANTSLIQNLDVKLDGSIDARNLLEVRVQDVETGVGSNASLIQLVDQKADGNTTALNQLDARIVDVEDDVIANASLLQEVSQDVENNTTALTTLETRVVDTEEGINANSSLIQQVRVDVDGNAVSLSQIDVRVTDTENDITSNATLIQSVDDKAEGAITSINQLDARVVDTEDNISTNASLIQQVEQKADGNNLAISQLETRVIAEEQFSLAQDVLNSEIDAELGEVRATASTQLVSISGLNIADTRLGEAQFYGSIKSLEQSRGLLKEGENISEAFQKLNTLTSDLGSQADSILQLEASSGTINGQVDSLVQNIGRVETKLDGTALAVQNISTKVNNVDGELSDAKVLLTSTIDELGQVSSRAFLGVSNTTSDGKRDITGVTVDSSTNGIRFKGDIFELATSSGDTALFYEASEDEWTFNGRLVIGGYQVNSESDIRALDGDTIYEVYQYSVDGSTNWHTTFTTGDLYRRSATVTNGVQGAWSTAAKIAGENGLTPAITTNPDGSYTISNGTDTITITDGVDAPIPTVTDNGDGTHTVTDGAGNSVIIRDGDDGYTPIKGTDYFDGNDGSFVSFIYKTGTTQPPTPSGGSFNGSTESIPNGWADTPYYENGKVTYVSTVRYESISGVWTKGSWSPPTEYIIKGEDGEVGAGFYGSTYSSISWTTSTATSRFTALVGRPPVKGDIFTQTRTDGADSQARQYTGPSWGSVALQVNGSIVASGTIAGDKLIAGTSISAPAINGGVITAATINGGTINGVDGNFTGTLTGNIITGAEIDGGTVTGAVINGGTINGADGYFSGTVNASNLNGDLVDLSLRRVTNDVSIGPSGTNLFSITVTGSNQFNRVIRISPILFGRSGGGTVGKLRLSLFKDTGAGVQEVDYIEVYLPPNGNVLSGELIHILSPAPENLFIRIVNESIQSNYVVGKQNITATIMKLGGTVNFTGDPHPVS